jgi:Concanavalin A-like lectin/glucanases superfamily
MGLTFSPSRTIFPHTQFRHPLEERLWRVMALLISTIGAIAAAGESAAQSYAASVAATDPTTHFQLYELAGANSVIDRIGGKPGFLVNPGDIEFRLPTLVEGGAASMAFGGDDNFPGYITVQDFLVADDLAVAAVVQPDIAKAKHVIITSREGSGGNRAGDLSVELVDDGAGGLKVRGFSVDATITGRVIEGSAGDVTPGQAVHLVYVRQSGVSPSQIIYVDGVVKAQDATVRAWPNVPSTNWHIGAWPVGPSEPLDGVIAEVVGWDTVPSQADLQSLSVAQGFSQVADFEADPIEISTVNNVGLKERPRIHTKGTITPSITAQGVLVTASPNGEAIQRSAGATVGLDSFDYRVTDDRGQTNIATISYEVTDTSPPPPVGSGPWQGLGVGVYIVSQAFSNSPYAGNVKVGVRFVAERTGQVRGIRHILKVNAGGQTGYSNGDGGTIRIDLHQHNAETDEPGTRIGTGTTITSPATSLPFSGGGGHEDEIQLIDNPKPTITAGQTYWWVFNQLEGGNVWVSTNNTQDNSYDPNGAPIFGTLYQTRRGTTLNAAAAQPWKNPVFSVVYTDGAEIGQNLIATVRTDRKSVNGSNRVRVRMIPTTDRTVRFVYAKCYKRTSQTSISVTVQVKNSGGTVLATATLPASSIGDDPNDGTLFAPDNNTAPWVRAALSSQLTLDAGETYFVEFSAASGADVWFFSMRVHPDFQDPRHAEIRGQFSSNSGSSWTNAWDHGAPATNALYSVLLHFD